MWSEFLDQSQSIRPRSIAKPAYPRIIFNTRSKVAKLLTETFLLPFFSLKNMLQDKIGVKGNSIPVRKISEYPGCSVTRHVLRYTFTQKSIVIVRRVLWDRTCYVIIRNLCSRVRR